MTAASRRYSGVIAGVPRQHESDLAVAERLPRLHGAPQVRLPYDVYTLNLAAWRSVTWSILAATCRAVVRPVDTLMSVLSQLVVAPCAPSGAEVTGLGNTPAAAAATGDNQQIHLVGSSVK